MFRYASLSIYLQSLVRPETGKHFVWYSTDLFDLSRNVAEDHVFVDLSSQKLIVSSHLSGESSYVPA
jgi:hypothetical protein